jgi:hypothetical protein
MYFDDNGPSTLDPPKWTKGGASVIGGCHGGAFGVNVHMYLNLSSPTPQQYGCLGCLRLNYNVI